MTTKLVKASSYFISLVCLSFYLDINVLKMQIQEVSMVVQLYIVEMFLWGTMLLVRPMVYRYVCIYVCNILAVDSFCCDISVVSYFTSRNFTCLILISTSSKIAADSYETNTATFFLFFFPFFSMCVFVSFGERESWR